MPERAAMDRATRAGATIEPAEQHGQHALVWAALVLLATFALAMWLLALSLGGGRNTDWTAFYAAGEIVRSGDADQLFDLQFQEDTQQRLFGQDAEFHGFPYPAFVAYAMAPVSSLNYRLSYTLWFFVNLGVLLSLIVAMRSHIRLMRQRDRLLWLAVTGVSAPVVAVLGQGQLDLIILASMLGCMTLISKDRPMMAGVVLAVAVAKPHFVAPVLILLALRGEWRSLAAFSCLGGALLLLPLALANPQAFLDQTSVWWSFASTTHDSSVNAPMMVNLRGTISSINGGAGALVWGLPLAIAGLAALLLSIRRWRDPATTNAQAWALALALPTVYSPHLHFQSLVLLLAGITLFVRVAVDIGDAKAPDRLIMLHPALQILWFVSSVSIGLVSFVVLATFGMFLWRWPGVARTPALRDQGRVQDRYRDALVLQ